ncbi:MAG: glycosyltransferase family 4 protein [Methanobacteriaceae archaeon]
MKIAYFTSKFPYEQSNSKYICGGSVFATESLVNEISKMGHDIKVFTTSMDSNTTYETRKNIKIYRYGTNLNIMSSNISLDLFIKPKKYDVDIVHVSFDMPPGPLAGLRYAKNKDLPLIITYHGDWDPSYGNIMRKIGVKLNNNLIVKDLLSYADLIISPSNLYIDKSQYLSKYNEKIRVIPNGIDLKEFDIKYSKKKARNTLNLPLDKKIILFFGYLSPYKSPDILLRAFQHVLKREENVILLFAGTGDMEKNLKTLAMELGMNNNVIFVGFVEKNKRALYYKSADIFCLPSTKSTECYPLAILEAVASKTPVIASDIGGISEIIKKDFTGMLIQPNNQKDLVNAILNLLKDSELRDKLSKNAYDHVKKYSWKNIANETNKLYLELGENNENLSRMC